MITTAQVLTLAAWPPSPLHLPEQISMAGRGDIINVPRYISLHVSRLDSPSKLLARLSREALDRIIPILSPSTPSPSTT